MRVSPDGKYIASGDRKGNVRYLLCVFMCVYVCVFKDCMHMFVCYVMYRNIYALLSDRLHSLENMQLLDMQPAHDAEVLTLDFVKIGTVASARCIFIGLVF